MPFTANRITDDEVDLWTIECCFALTDEVLQSHFIGYFLDLALGALPESQIATIFFGIVVTETQSRGNVHVEGAEHQLRELHHILDLFLELILRAVNVGIVLRESPHATQSVQLTRLLIPIHGAKLRQSHWQIAVGMGLVGIDLVVVRTVHRLEQVLLVFHRDGIVLRVGVVWIVARCLVQFQITDVRSDHFLITTLLLFITEEGFKATAQGGSIRQPHGQAPSHHWRDGIDFQLLAQLTVIPLFGLLTLMQKLFQHLLLGEGYAVDARELLARYIATPVGASHTKEFRKLQVSRMWHVRSAT